MSAVNKAMVNATNLMKKCDDLIKDLGEMNREYVAHNELLRSENGRLKSTIYCAIVELEHARECAYYSDAKDEIFDIVERLKAVSNA